MGIIITVTPRHHNSNVLDYYCYGEMGGFSGVPWRSSCAMKNRPAKNLVVRSQQWRGLQWSYVDYDFICPVPCLIFHDSNTHPPHWSYIPYITVIKLLNLINVKNVENK